MVVTFDPYGSRRPAPRPRHSRDFLPALAALRAGQLTSWARARARPLAEETSLKKLDATVEVAIRPSSSARALLVAVGTYVPAEFGSCADAKLAVDAR
jgi:hypothetical protein